MSEEFCQDIFILITSFFEEIATVSKLALSAKSLAPIIWSSLQRIKAPEADPCPEYNAKVAKTLNQLWFTMKKFNCKPHTYFAAENHPNTYSLPETGAFALARLLAPGLRSICVESACMCCESLGQAIQSLDRNKLEVLELSTFGVEASLAGLFSKPLPKLRRLKITSNPYEAPRLLGLIATSTQESLEHVTLMSLARCDIKELTAGTRAMVASNRNSLKCVHLELSLATRADFFRANGTSWRDLNATCENVFGLSIHQLRMNGHSIWAQWLLFGGLCYCDEIEPFFRLCHPLSDSDFYYKDLAFPLIRFVGCSTNSIAEFVLRELEARKNELEGVIGGSLVEHCPRLAAKIHFVLRQHKLVLDEENQLGQPQLTQKFQLLLKSVEPPVAVCKTA